MAQICSGALAVLRVGAIATAAAVVLFPFYDREDRGPLLLGSGIAAVAGIASSFVSRRGLARGNFAAAFLTATGLRFGLCMIGLLVCHYVLSPSFLQVAMSLLIAYQALLVFDTWALCRAQSARRFTQAQEVKR